MYKNRVIAIAVSVFAAGVGIGISMKNCDTFSSYAIFSFMAIAAVIALVIALKFKGKTAYKSITTTAFAVAVLSLGVLRVLLFNSFSNDNYVYNNQTDVAELEILEINQNSMDTKIISSELGINKGEKIRIYPNFSFDDHLIGDKLVCELKYRYNDSNQFLSNGCTLSGEAMLKSHEKGSGLFYSIRKSVKNSSNDLYGNFRFASDIVRGVTIGDRTGMDSYIFSVYQAAGISHILAISGLHISIVSMTLCNLLVSFTVNRKIASLISSVFALFYTSLVGFTPGAVRATVMLLMVMIMRLFMRDADSFTSLFLALFILLLENPYSLFSAGLQLSFLCSLGILLCEPLIESVNSYLHFKGEGSNGINKLGYRIIKLVATPIIISFASSVFTFPVIFISFDVFSYISPLVNLVAVPLFTWAIELCIISVLLAPVLYYVAIVFAYPAGALFDFITYISELIYDYGAGTMSVHIPFMFIPLVLSAVMVCILIFAIDNKTKMFSVASAAFCISLVFCSIYHSLSADNSAFVEYGYSNGEYIYYSEQESNMYIDLGGYTSNPDVVFQSGFTTLDNYIMLDYSGYSLNRYEYMSGNLKIGHIYLPEPKNSHDMSYFRRIKELANNRKCDIMFINNSFNKGITENSSVEIKGVKGDFSSENLVYLNINELRIGCLANGYVGSAQCDIAILGEDYVGNRETVYSDKIYCPKESIEHLQGSAKGITEFYDSLRIKIDISESEFSVYEP